jgi:uncharacterized protein (TIGR03083 family)
MNDGHAAVSELLGAWALDACSEQEAATVEAHLAGCRACAAEADRLGRATGGLGTTAAVSPPAWLRGAVLAAAVARRPAVGGEEAASGYAAWVDRFDGLLGELTPAQWRARVIHDWTVQDLVAHLTASDELLVDQLAAGRAEAPEDPAELDGTLPARRTAAAIGEHRGLPPERTRTAWRGQADDLLRNVAGQPAGLDRPVRLTDPRLPRQPLRIALVQRLFETWIHSDDLRPVLGEPLAPPDPRQVALIAGFGIRLLPTAMRLLGAGHPPRGARLVLVGPGGGDWTLSSGPGPTRAPDVTVTMDAVEFCYLLGKRRDPDSVAHVVEGDRALAATLLHAAATLGCD